MPLPDWTRRDTSVDSVSVPPDHPAACQLQDRTCERKRKYIHLNCLLFLAAHGAKDTTVRAMNCQVSKVALQRRNESKPTGQCLRWEKSCLMHLKAYSVKGPLLASWNTCILPQGVENSYNSTLQNQPQKTLEEAEMCSHWAKRTMQPQPQQNQEYRTNTLQAIPEHQPKYLCHSHMPQIYMNNNASWDQKPSLRWNIAAQKQRGFINKQVLFF